MNVNVGDEQFRVTGVFGQTVQFEDVEDIILLETSMREMDIVATDRWLRTSGTSGFILLSSHRGHFSRRYIFAQVNQAPTIQITRSSGDPIFLNFRNDEKTRELYEDLVEAWQLSQ